MNFVTKTLLCLLRCMNFYSAAKPPSPPTSISITSQCVNFSRKNDSCCKCLNILLQVTLQQSFFPALDHSHTPNNILLCHPLSEKSTAHDLQDDYDILTLPLDGKYCQYCPLLMAKEDYLIKTIQKLWTEMTTKIIHNS